MLERGEEVVEFAKGLTLAYLERRNAIGHTRKLMLPAQRGHDYRHALDITQIDPLDSNSLSVLCHPPSKALRTNTLTNEHWIRPYDRKSRGILRDISAIEFRRNDREPTNVTADRH